MPGYAPARFVIVPLVASVVAIGPAPATPGTPELSAPAPAVARMEDIRWVRIPAGKFVMGCERQNERCERGNLPRHTVSITRPFWMSATEVTVGQYRPFAEASHLQMPRQPRWNDADSYPTVNETWIEARAFCAWAGGRLPSEAEWEYAARGGTDGRMWDWGDNFDPSRVNSVGRSGSDIWEMTAPVGSLPPNGFGLYDMEGNVWEWTNDVYTESYYRKSPAADPPGPAEGPLRVIRGGSWDSDPVRLVLSFRAGMSSTARYNLYFGFRCAR